MALKAVGVSKSFKGNPIIQSFDFIVEPHEIVALVGKSGTGKTTFLRILTQLEKADEGCLSIDNHFLFQTIEDKGIQYVSKERAKHYRSHIGLVFQEFHLFPNLTVLENCLEASLSQNKKNKESITERAKGLLEQLDISDKESEYPVALSGGQKQRVAIARAMMLEPAFLCFDEPTSALDSESASGIGQMIENIAAEGTGIILITHDLEFAEKYATRIVSSADFLKQDSPMIQAKED